MSRKRFTTEKIIGMLREADVALAQGMCQGALDAKMRSLAHQYNQKGCDSTADIEK